MKYFCCDQRRRQGVLAHGTLNGIDYLEVLDSPSMASGDRQRILHLYLLKELVPASVPDRDRLRIDGGDRITGIEVLEVESDLATEPRRLALTVDRPGDFSTYTLRLVDDAGAPLAGYDPLLSRVDFSFKAGCAGAVDCREERAPCPDATRAPVIDYLAKDYASFRRLMLDRMAVLIPQWRETSPADLGVALVELLAYVGDRLSYRQDAVATEAYLETARRRVSVRRHARLVDYPIHEGTNARVWAQLRVSSGRVELPAGTRLLTRVAGLGERLTPGSEEVVQALGQRPEVFETLHDAVLHQLHDTLAFYTWGSRECCLPRGATKATLRGAFPDLRAGEVLVFEEVRGATTGRASDADPGRRHAVRLTHVVVTEDPAGGRFVDPASDDPRPVTEIEWSPADALPFPLCISAPANEESGGETLEDVTVARGNIVLADHGLWIEGEALGEVPAADPVLARPPAPGQRCASATPRLTPPRFRPALAEAPLTRALPSTVRRLASVPFEAAQGADLSAGTLPAALAQALASRGIWLDRPQLSIQGGAGPWSLSDGTRAFAVGRRSEEGADLLELHELPAAASETVRAAGRNDDEDGRRALPVIRLEDGDGQEWRPVRDLLASGPTARELVVESESDGSSFLRFGDDRFGRRPEPGVWFTASYRVGNGSAGNIGAQTLHHVVSAESGIVGVRNPLPARGGRDPEPLEEVRQVAPYAFRRQERAVTPEDYAAVARRHPEVQNAAATLRWTGSWHTVFLTVDRFGGRTVDSAFEEELRRFLDRFRMMGHDLEIDGPRMVPLEIALAVCVAAEHDGSRIEQEIRRRLGSRENPDGSRGLFHPDRLTFGQPVYLSEIYAAAQGVEGVAEVVVDTFRRLDSPSPVPLKRGRIDLSRLEVARLDNDPNFPERGLLRVRVESAP